MGNERSPMEIDEGLVEAHAGRFSTGENNAQNRASSRQAISNSSKSQRALGAALARILRQPAPQFGAGSPNIGD
jgi:hypothetical protein